MPNKPAYTPAEFAALFGKERTWGYRQIYAGKVNAVTIFGSIMIPVEEVEKVMAGASRYGVAGNAITRRTPKKKAAKRKITQARNSAWKKYLSHRNGKKQTGNNSNTSNGNKIPSAPITRGTQKPSAIMSRLSRSRTTF